jgi:hypothetical protein
MRKVQSSVQLMERSRNPGVGYWSSISNAGPSTMAVPTPRSGVTSPGAESMMGTPTKESRRSMESLDTRASPSPSTAPSEASKPKPSADEEEVNLEVRQLANCLMLEADEGSTSVMSSCSSWRTRRCGRTSCGSCRSSCASRRRNYADSMPSCSHNACYDALPLVVQQIGRCCREEWCY